jgi:MerR family mercuric resistance operon transcriptional regulator
MQRLTIGRLAEASGVHLETIRYYERIGLVRKPPRTAGGYRLYGETDLARLRFIRCGRDLGFGLKKIQDLLILQDAPSATCEQVRLIAQEQIEAIDAKIMQFLRMKETLKRVVKLCPTAPLPADCCPVLNYMADCMEKCEPEGCGLPQSHGSECDRQLYP